MDANSSEPHCAFLQNRTRDVDELELESEDDEGLLAEGSALPKTEAVGLEPASADDMDEEVVLFLGMTMCANELSMRRNGVGKQTR